jgi:hypothetical protein
LNKNFENSSLFIRFFFVKIALIALFTGFLSPELSAQSQQKSNLEILEQDITSELDRFLYYPGIERTNPFVFRVTSLRKNKEEKKFLENLIKKSAAKEKLKISFISNDEAVPPDSVYNICRIDIEKIKTSYTRLIKNRFLGEKSMERMIKSELKIEIVSNAGAILVKDNINTVYKDEIPYDGYEKYESAEYSFTQSFPPDISFIESIIFPAAVITASAVAAILFFTIRSK